MRFSARYFCSDGFGAALPAVGRALPRGLPATRPSPLCGLGPSGSRSLRRENGIIRMPIEGEYQRESEAATGGCSGSPRGWPPPPLHHRRSPELRASDGGSGRMASPTSAKIGELDAHNSSGLCTSRGPRCMIGPQHASPSFSPTYQAYHSRQIATHERRGLAFIREGRTPALVRRACRKRANAIRRSF